jgi:hypothetical protein
MEVYLTPDDEKNLMLLLQAKHQVVLHRVVYYTEQQRVVTSLDSLGVYPTDRQLVLTSPDFLSLLSVTHFTRGHFRVNLTDSPLIIFD